MHCRKVALTFFCRHSISGVFDPENAMPQGHIDSSVILVPAARPARLEDMSYYEPAVRLRTHKFVIDGTLIERTKGGPDFSKGPSQKQREGRYVKQRVYEKNFVAFSCSSLHRVVTVASSSHGELPC